MQQKSSKQHMTYEPEADVLRIEVNKQPIDYASEIGNVVVHFSKEGVPVYIEVLEATKFLKQASALVPAPLQKAGATG